MIVRVKFQYEMEYWMKTWSNLSVEGNGFWTVNEDELAIEFSESEYTDFKEFLNFYFKDFSGLDLDNINLSINEEDLKYLEEEIKSYI